MGRRPISHKTPSADMIAAYQISLEAARRSQRTIETKIWLLHRLDMDLLLGQLAEGSEPSGLAGALPHELTAWLAKNGDTASAKAAYRAHIVMFYRWATDDADQWLSYDPSLRLPRPRVRKGVANPAPDDVVRRCVSEAAQPWRLHCILAAYAGLRPMEIAQLHREQVTEKWLTVVAGKGAKHAILPTEPPVWRAIRDLPKGPITRQPNGLPATYKWVSAATAQYLRGELDVDVTLRRMRHWHGTWLRRNFDLRVVQERMRHESLATTQIYTAVTDAELAGSVGQLPDFTEVDVAGSVAPAA